MRREFLQDHNRSRPDSDGRPGRDENEIRDWAREHDLPYFDGQVHFPDYRIEYEVDGRERHEDVELFTPHYRGAHAVSRTKTGFRIYLYLFTKPKAANQLFRTHVPCFIVSRRWREYVCLTFARQ